ncbi:heme-degrading domain-containing protein [Pelagibacterium sp.]|uniref:heme-degrading domain-containing protein n=1 Tax=Pelagibacterium sp. TaxID=1967288 RepID=UPI003A952CD6
MHQAEPTLEELVSQQTSLVLERFDYAVAWAIGAHMRDTAVKQGLPIAIEISHGNAPVFLALMEGATPDNIDWVRRKRAVAIRFHQSSLYMRIQSQQNSWDFSKRFRLPEQDYVASGGSIPISVRGAGVIGAATVSGLTDVRDHQLVAEALGAIRDEQARP